MEIYYVKRVYGADFDHIPISMFGEPAIFSTRQEAERFKVFADGTGASHEVCE